MSESDTQVYLVVYSHKHGVDRRVCKDEEAADIIIIELAGENLAEFEDDPANAELVGTVRAAVEKSDVDTVVEQWNNYTGMLEYFELIGPIPVETKTSLLREAREGEFPWNIQTGDDVCWTDPVGGKASVITVVEVDYHGEKGKDDCVISLQYNCGSVQCYASELS